MNETVPKTKYKENITGNGSKDIPKALLSQKASTCKALAKR
jgi:hypothetical protein